MSDLADKLAAEAKFVEGRGLSFVNLHYSDVPAIVEALRDAKRYRYLKEHHLQLGPDAWIRTGDDLDDAIDEGLRSQPQSVPHSK